jgi:hypothetical protein
MTAVEPGSVYPDDPVSWEKRDRAVEKNPPNSHVKAVERLTQRRRRRDFLKIEGAPNPRHLNKFVKERPVRRILPNLETEEDDVLMKCVPPFREFR